MKQLILKKDYLISTDFIAFILRLILAIIFIAHGSQKVFGVFGGNGLQGTTQWMSSQLGIPLFAAYLACFVELFAGIGLLIGFLSRIWALLLVIQMLVAMSMAHTGFFAPKGIEFPLLILFVAVTIFLTGSGKYSVDNMLAK